MDEKDTAAEASAPETEQQNRENPAEASVEARPRKWRSRKANRILTAVLTALLIVLALIVFAFRDALTEEGLRKSLKKNGAASDREAFTYETGAEQVFAAAGDGLAVASSSSVQLLDAKGQTVFKQVVSFETPAVFACGDRALFCDLGGTGCIVAGTDGESKSLGVPAGDSDRRLLSASMNESGWIALVTAEPGYKALVSVYNADCEKQYEWWSGSAYVLRAAVSPDNRHMAVLCADKSGTLLRLFALNSEELQAELGFPNELFYDVSYLDSGALCVIGDPGVAYVSAEGKLKAQYRTEGSFLLDYALTSDFVTLFVSDYRSGGGGTLLTLDGKGGVLGTAALERDVISLSARGKQLLVMTGDSLVLYDQALVRQYANDTLMTAKRAILRSDGDILLLSAYAAERFGF